MSLLKATPRRPLPVPCVTEVIEQYYESMWGWAMGLTRGDSQRAEDILHDLCLHLVATQPDLSRIENLDGYLYTSLRHVYLSHLSRSSREALEQITTAEFDSIYLALFADHRSDALSQQNELRRICNYVLARKNEAKSASYFILQFFYGFTVQETAALARVTTAAVHNKVRRLRDELRRNLSNAEDLRVEASSLYGLVLHWKAVGSAELFQEIRRGILLAREGECASGEGFAGSIGMAGTDRLNRLQLSHMVSCEHCLQRARRGVDTGQSGGRAAGPGGGEGRVSRGTMERVGPESSPHSSGTGWPLRDRTAFLGLVKEHELHLRRHRPSRLSIAVDGKVVASQDVRARFCVQSARIERPEDASFIEVFSEQGLRLALLPVGDAPPRGAAARRQRMALSDGRWVELTLSFDGLGLNGQVAYYDPRLPSGPLGADGNMPSVRDRRHSFPSGVGALGDFRPQTPVIAAVGGWRSMCRGLRCRMEGLRVVPRFLEERMNLLLIGALICGAATVVCLLLWFQGRPRLTADAFLRRAEAHSTPVASASPGVIYQKVGIYRGSGRRLERALYRDTQGKRHPKQQAVSMEDEKLKRSLEQAGVNWNDPLSPSTYRDWHTRKQVRTESVAEAGRGLLQLKTVVDSDPVAEETLTVRASDFHPVARTIRWEDQSTVEIAELNYDVMPWGVGSEGWFEPLAGNETAVPGMSQRPSRGIVMPSRLTEAEVAETELDVRIALHDLAADGNDWIAVSAGPSGVRVHGLVESEERKRDIVTRLETIAHVRPDLLTFAEAQRRESPADRTSTVVAAAAGGVVSPLDEWMRNRGADRDAAGRLAMEISDSYVKVGRESKALERLMGRFGEGADLTEDVRRKLLQLTGQHRAAALAALDTEQQLLSMAGLVPGRGKSLTQLELSAALEDNSRLCGELISDGADGPRSALSIATELDAAITALRAALHTLHLPDATSEARSGGASPRKN